MCHFSGPLPKPPHDAGLIEHKPLAPPTKITRVPTEQVGKELKAEDGKEDGKEEEKVTSIPRILPHRLYDYPVPGGTGNDSPFSITITSLGSLLPLSCPQAQRQT